MNHPERLKQLKRAFVAFVRPYSVAVCGADTTGAPVFGATGFFLSLPKGVVLVTAEHVIKGVSGRPRALVHNVAVDLGHQARFATDSLNLPRNEADIATILLSASEAALVPSASLVPYACVSQNPRVHPQGPYVALGFHEPDQTVDRVDLRVGLAQTYVMLTEGKQAFYVSYQKSRARQLLLGGRPSLIVTPNGRGGIPHFHGMSGSPVWRITTGVPPTKSLHPPLVAILVAQPNNSRKIIQCDRVGLLTQHLQSAHPELF